MTQVFPDPLFTPGPATDLGTQQNVTLGNFNLSSLLNVNTRIWTGNRTGSGTRTLDLPAVASAQDWPVTVKHQIGSAVVGTLTLNPTGGATINGTTSYDVPLGANIVMVHDGVSDWKVIKVETDFVDPRNVIQVANGQTIIRGSCPFVGVLIGFQVFTKVKNANGAYTLGVINEGTGNDALAAAAFDMQTLAADTWTAVALTNTATDRQFAANGAWTATLTSDNPSFNGSGILIEPIFAAGA